MSTGLCALVEAALFAVNRPYIRQLEESGSLSGRLLAQYKDTMDYPISAILIFDTILGVGGAAIAGSQARELFGADFVIWFSIVLSATLLVVSQIIPKVIGVVYNRRVAKLSAIPVSFAIKLVYPVVWIIEKLTRHLKPDEPVQRASEDEVKQMARMSAEEGSILDVEAELIQNSLALNDLVTSEIMTPFPEVVTLSCELTVKEAFSTFQQSVFNQMPVHVPDNQKRWLGVVKSRDILSEMAQDRFEVRLKDIAKPLHLIDANTPGHLLLNAFLTRRTGLLGVTSSRIPVGVVSLGDIIEELVGDDIPNDFTD